MIDRQFEFSTRPISAEQARRYRMVYPGGKNGAGIFQRIINYMPPHETYIEAFLGSGAVLRNKRPATRNVGIDRSAEAIDLCLELADQAGVDQSEFRLLEGDALKLLPSLKPMLSDSRTVLINQPTTLLYVDPPYMLDTRKGGDIYDFEMDDDAHADLLDILNDARCMVMISGYRSPLYDDALYKFTRVDYQAQTRRGLVPESLWMNFEPPVALHDYSHLGRNFRERERIKRKKDRFAAKFSKMDRQERLAIMEVLTGIGSER